MPIRYIPGIERLRQARFLFLIRLIMASELSIGMLCGSTSTTRASIQDESPSNAQHPKDKKRIQNRVAQRAYRHRLKARLEDLQGKLDFYEKTSKLNGTGPHTTRTTSVTESIINCENQSHNDISVAGADEAADQLMLEHSEKLLTVSSVDNASERGSQPSSTFPQLEPQRELLQIDGFPLASTSGTLRALQQSRLSDHIPTDSDLSGVPISSRAISAPQEHNQPSLSQPECFAQDHFTDIIINDLQDIEGTDSSEPIIITSPERLSHTGLELWEHESIVDQAYNLMLSPNSTSATCLVPTDLSTKLGNDLRAKAHSALYDRLESALRRIEEDSFENLDALIAAYYGVIFTESSHLGSEQWLSRNRRLPQVLARIFQSSIQWTSWEQKVLSDEIMRVMEAKLAAEGDAAQDAFSTKWHNLASPESTASAAATEQITLEMRGLFIQKLPSLWVLLVSLSSRNRLILQKDRANIACAIILLLQLSGRVPKKQLLELVSACL
ncbi:hypothetical protein NLU13_0942 [Sarocladium strictum]|uniref:BZIP domain-containing protein n=1 Tax=Sarocladium strictum TaxID=5046 RepID=A0AA39LBA1_SARSR|nr:hypothetical protein NLU13_0942 [Sarocladium strictum]